MKNISRYFIVLICIFCNINILISQWVQTSCPDSWINSFAVSGTNLFAGTVNGIYLSTDNGRSWKAADSGLTSIDVSCFAVMGTNIFAGTYNNGIYISTNNGMNWTFSGLTNTWVTAIAVCGNNIFAGTNDNGIILSTNNGTNWTAVSSAGIRDTLRFPTVSALAVTVNGSGDTSIFAGMSGINVGGVYLLTNNGTNWTAVDSGLTNTQIAALAARGDNIFAGTRSGVFLSSNNGTSWSAVDSGLTNNGPIPTIYSLSILPNGKSSTNIFAGTWNGVYQSTNNGTSWNAINSGLPINTPIYALAILPNGKGDTNLFAGTIHGVWQHPFSQWTPTISLNQYSIEFGSPPSTWKQTKTATLKITCGSLAPLIIDSVYTMTKWFVVASVHDTIAEGDTVSLLISFTPDSLSVPQYYDTLFIISNSIYSLIKVPLRGIIEIPISVSQSGSDIPNIFGLSQNYPNPFNPTTIINYQLPVSNFVTLKVYNILGREVEILVNEKKNAGNYSIAFNAAKLSSGVYFYRLQAGSFTKTKKLILLR